MISLDSKIIVSEEFEAVKKELEISAKEQGAYLFSWIKEGNFLVQDVEEVIEKAYLSSKEKQILLLGADSFSEVVQNRLLKIIEEPPKNKEFILLFKSKAQILPTIRSRLPIEIIKNRDFEEDFPFDLDNLNIRTIYEGIQKLGRFDAKRGKFLAQRLLKEAISSDRYDLDEKSLNLFRDSIRVLDIGSPPPFVLTALLLKLLEREKR